MMRVALVGAGKIAVEEHLPAWATVENATVTCVVDKDVDRARAIASRWGIPSWSADMSEALEMAVVDAVDICTSAFTHEDLVQTALGSGVHVLVEKPLTARAASAQALCESARSAHRVLMVAENWPYSSAFRRVQEIVASGKLGHLHSVAVIHRSGLRRGPARPDHSVLGHTFIAGSHAVHLMRLLMGNVSRVMGYWQGPASRGAHGMVLDAAAEIVFAFEDGAMGSMHISSLAWEAGPRQLFMRLEGDRGQMEFDVLAGWVTVTTEEGKRTDSPRVVSMGYREELQAFCERVSATAAAPFVDDPYVETLRVIEAIYRSFDGGMEQQVREQASP